jgi:hypothetical protein
MSKTENLTKYLNGLKTVEMSSEVVELALIDDMQKAMQTVNKELSNANGSTSKASAALEEAFTAYRQSAVYAKQVTDIYAQFEAKAKELGVDIPANAKKLNDDASQYLKSSQDKMKLFQTLKGQLSK